MAAASSSAEVALCCKDVRQLYYDLETLRDHLLAPPPDGESARALAAVLEFAPFEIKTLRLRL